MIASDIIIQDFAEELVLKLRANINSVTGKSAESIMWRYDGKSLQIYSVYSWITVLEDGRPPGKWPPRKEILSWIDAVGMTSEVPKNSLAYLIQRKIGEEGTELYRQGGHSGVLSDYLNEEYVQLNLIDKLRDEYMNTIIQTLLR